MSIALVLGTPASFKIVYVDAVGAPTDAPAGSNPVAWSVSDPAVATVEPAVGLDATLTAVGAAGSTATLTVTDGVFSSTQDVTVSAVPAAGIEIQPA